MTISEHTFLTPARPIKPGGWSAQRHQDTRVAACAVALHAPKPVVLRRHDSRSHVAALLFGALLYNGTVMLCGFCYIPKKHQEELIYGSSFYRRGNGTN